MTRPQWRVLHEGEEPPAGRAAQDVGDGKRAWLDDLDCIDDDADDDVDVDADADADALPTAPSGNGVAPEPAATGAAAAALRDAAARLAEMDEDERALQRRPEAKRLNVRVSDLDAAIKRAQAAAEAALAEQQAEAEGPGPGFSTVDEPEETLDDEVQRLTGMDGLDYVTALREVARRFKIPVAALDDAVRRKREPPPAPPGAAGVLPRSFRLDETGLWFQPLPSSRNPEPAPVFVCGPFQVLGEARDLEGRDWGVVITWLDHDRRPHTWSCPQRLVHLDGNSIAAELAAAGLTCGTSKEAHELLKQFFGSLRTSDRLQSAERTGWRATSAHAGIVTQDATVICKRRRDNPSKTEVAVVSGWPE